MGKPGKEMKRTDIAIISESWKWIVEYRADMDIISWPRKWIEIVIIKERYERRLLDECSKKR